MNAERTRVVVRLHARAKDDERPGRGVRKQFGRKGRRGSVIVRFHPGGGSAQVPRDLRRSGSGRGGVRAGLTLSGSRSVGQR